MGTNLIHFKELIPLILLPYVGIYYTSHTQRAYTLKVAELGLEPLDLLTLELIFSLLVSVCIHLSYVCMYFECVDVHICSCVHVHMHVCAHVCDCVCVYMCTCKLMGVMCICMCTCACMCVHVHAWNVHMHVCQSCGSWSFSSPLWVSGIDFRPPAE